MRSEAHLYKEAGILYCKVASGVCNLKNGLFQSNFTSDLKKLLAIVAEAIKNKAIINEVFKRSNTKKKENKSQNDFQRECIDGTGCFDCNTKVQIHDMLFGHATTNTSGCPLIGKLRVFNNILEEIMQENNLTSKEEVITFFRPEDKSITLPTYVRVNFLLTTFEEVVKHFTDAGFNYLHYEDGSTQYNQFLEWAKGLKELDFMPDFHLHNELLVFHSSASLHNDKFVQLKKVLIQDKASCIPAVILNPQLDMDTIDACAAPGNKTTHILSLLSRIENNSDKKVSLFALDRDETRFKFLRSNLAQYAAPHPISKSVNVISSREDFSRIDPLDPRYQNVGYICLDPSCSGTGIMRQVDRVVERNSNGRVNEDRLKSLRNFQAMLLSHALSFPRVKRVVYSTCSITIDENEHVVQEIMEKFGAEFALTGIWSDRWMTRGKKNMKQCLRTNPSYDLCNGFFVACFDRVAESDGTMKPRRPASTRETVIKAPIVIANKKKRRHKKTIVTDNEVVKSEVGGVGADIVERKKKKKSKKRQLFEAMRDQQAMEVERTEVSVEVVSLPGEKKEAKKSKAKKKKV